MKLPRFTLRELFLIVVIAAMGCGWAVEHFGYIAPENEQRQLNAMQIHEEYGQEIQRLEEQLRELGETPRAWDKP